MDSFFNGVVATTAFFGIILAIILPIIQNRQYKKQERLKFLGDIAINRTYPMEYRQPFYDEYKSLKGNGTVEKAWLLELTEKQRVING